MSLINLQKRLAASIIKCGKRKIWIDPNEIKEISLADSRKYNVKIFHLKKIKKFKQILILRF